MENPKYLYETSELFTNRMYSVGMLVWCRPPVTRTVHEFVDIQPPTRPHLPSPSGSSRQDRGMRIAAALV